MDNSYSTHCTAFDESRCIVSGELALVAIKTKEFYDRTDSGTVFIFDDVTGERIEVDLSGTAEDVRRRFKAPPVEIEPDAASADTAKAGPRGPGRPRLGVVAREVTLLPRHWDWLNSQPGGASVALRKLVEVARRVNESKDRIRQSQEAAYRFMSPMAGDRPGFEEATRALFAGKRERFDELTEPWPADIRDYVRKLAAAAFPETVPEPSRLEDSKLRSGR
jgi:uncharacterized protein